MYVLSVKITTTNVKQPVVPAAVVPDSIHPIQSMIPQNNGTHNIYLGDVNVSATNGLVFYPTGSGQGMQNVLAYGTSLDEFYVYGTAGDIMTFMIFQ